MIHYIKSMKHERNMEIINTHQQLLYEQYDKNTASEEINSYAEILNKYRSRGKLRILDIGGASGNFALSLAEYFDLDTQIFVLDNMEYATWQNEAYKSKITFIHDSVEHLDSVFKDEEPFDLIFANRVFHHFIKKGWIRTLKGMDDVLRQIQKLLAENGTLCIKDHFYNGRIFDKATSFLIFSMTTCKISGIAKFVQKNGAHSAGVGVCFQSEKMWIKRVEKIGFRINGIEKQPYKLLSPKKSFFLLCKEYSLDNNIYIVKAN